MKKTLLYCLIAFITLNACGDKAKKETNSENISNTKIVDNEEKEEDVTYVRKDSCDDFISDIDFSSFCFTSKKTPKYRLVRNTETNCQFQIHDDNGYQNIDFSIAFADFNKPFGKEPQPELAKNIFVKTFARTKSRRLGGSEAKEISDIGDEAYIGYNRSQDNKEQYLGVRVGNVTFTFVFHHGKEKSQQSCMEAEEDLINIGKLVIENLTK